MAAISATCSTALGDSIWMTPRIRPLIGPDVGVAEPAQPCTTGRQRQAAGTVRRVAHERDRFAGLLGEVDPRDHDPVRPEIERPTDPQPLPGLRPDERSRGRRPGRVELAEQVGLGAGAVLEVDHQPVEPGPGDQLGRDRRPEPDERAEQRLAGAEPVAEVDEAGDGRGGELICHDAMMPGRRSAAHDRATATPPATTGR